MVGFFEDRLYRVLDRDDAWFGIRWLKLAPEQPYTSLILLKVCLIYGVATAALVYVMTRLIIQAMLSPNSLRDDAAWLPRLASWFSAVFFVLTQCVSMWTWNRRARHLNPAVFRYRRRSRKLDSFPGMETGFHARSNVNRQDP